MVYTGTSPSCARQFTASRRSRCSVAPQNRTPPYPGQPERHTPEPPPPGAGHVAPAPTRAVAVAAAHLLADSERRRRRARACRALTRRGARAALTPPLNARASRHGARSTPAAGVAQLCDPYLTVAYEPYVQ